MKNLILLFTLLICVANTTFAQWQPTESVLGGEVRSLAVNGSTVFSIVSGSVFASSNNGNTWTDVSNGLSGVNPTTLAVVGTSIFLGTDSNGVFVSTDNGNTWRGSSRGLMGLNITALAANGTNIFAGTSGDGVFLSTDNGANWRAVNNGLTLSFIGRRYIRAIATRGNTVYISNNDSVFSSSDNGSNWTDVGGGLEDPLGNPSVVVSALLVSGDKIYAASFNGIFVLANNSTTWAPSGLQNTAPSSLAVSGTTLYAGTMTGVYVSLNGANWIFKNTGINRLYVNTLATIGTTVIAGTNGSVFTSQNNGDNWNTKNNGLKKAPLGLWADGTNVFASSYSSLYISANDGTTWTETNYDKTAAKNVTDVYVSGANIFATSLEGVNLSSNKGETWSERNSGLANPFFNNPFIFSIANIGTNLFALSTTNSRIFKSTNNGSSWTGINTDFGDFSVTKLMTSGAKMYAFGIRFNFSPTSNVQAATAHCIFLSTDNGNNWSQILTTSGTISSLLTRGTNTFVGTNEGVFVSANNGSNWTDVTNNLPTSNPALGTFALATTGNFLFTSAGKKGVYLSTNNGSSWRAANEGLSDIYIDKLVVSGNYLFAATENGIFRRPLSDFNALGINEKGTFDCSIFPNPVSNQLTINCSDELIGKKYLIQDVLGTTISSNLLNDKSTVVPLNDAPNGVYFLHLIGTTKTIKFVKQ